MNYNIFFACIVFTSFGNTPLSHDQITTIAHKIWHNECNGTVKGLTTWNKGETCASLGIGHFIWYPDKKSDRFKETFPALLSFLQEQGVSLPKWLTKIKSCPWKNRTAFYKDINSPHMQELRILLAATIEDQARFIVKRLDDVLPGLLQGCSLQEKTHIQKLFEQLSGSTQGMYALIDYLNFKGAGTGIKERYHQKGWGLKQVLLATSLSENPLQAFASAAKKVLQQRVSLAPKERHEERWLSGWLNRIDSYVKS